MEAYIWYFSLILGALLFLGGSIYLFLRRKRSQSDYIKAAAIELAAGWILLIPYEYYVEITVDSPLLRVVESCLTALIRALNVFSVEGYERVAFQGHEEFSSVFSIVRVLVSIFLALFACGWVISFFEGPAQYLKLFFRSRRETYVFNECNDKSIAIAKSIVCEGKKANIIILEHNESALAEKLDSDNVIHIAMPLRKTIRFVSAKAPYIEVYLFGSKEEGNLSALEEAFAEPSVIDCNSIRFFVELNKTPWALYDDYVVRKLGNGVKNVLVNFVRTEENYIYNMLAGNSIFTHTVPENGVLCDKQGCKRIHILIVGMNERNIDFLKAVLHLGQMPGYFLKITVFDEKSYMCELQNLFPAIHFNTRYCKEGDAFYSLFYFENVNVESQELENMIDRRCRDYTFAYVNTGDDLKNVSLGIRLANQRCRTDSDWNFKINVNLSKLDAGKWNQARFNNVSFSGFFDAIYSRSFITMSGIEKASIKIHNLRQKERKAFFEASGKKYELQSWDEYCNSEYNRHSVYARTLAFLYKKRIIEKYYESDYSLTQTVEWKISEHMRWNMYTRTIGYRDPDELSKAVFDKIKLDSNGQTDKTKLIKSFRSKTGVHEDLIPYELLEVEEQEKDSMTLEPEIREILGKIIQDEEECSV